jgi:hypothetical protein
MSTLTDANMTALEACASEEEWNSLCLAIKKEHGGYPSDWFPRVLGSGMMKRIMDRFGGDDRIRVSPIR